MVFNVFVYFKKLVSSNDKVYSLMIADTVLISENSNINLTQEIVKSYEDISYQLSDVNLPPSS